MSPWTKAARFDGPRFPRVSGDESVTQQGGADKPMFSPRERG